MCVGLLDAWACLCIYIFQVLCCLCPRVLLFKKYPCHVSVYMLSHSMSVSSLLRYHVCVSQKIVRNDLLSMHVASKSEFHWFQAVSVIYLIVLVIL